MIDYKSFLTTAQLVRLGREYWWYDAVGAAKDEPLCAALLIIREEYRDVVWC